MAYEISFTKKVSVSDPDIYINDCCWGGDVVRDQLLPLISDKFEDVMTAQEDWGWFIWFRSGDVRLGIDIFCDDPHRGDFRIHLTAKKKILFVARSYVASPELEQVRSVVTANLADWGSAPVVNRIKL